ncbi:MAG: NUDIX domain-containing protein [Methylophilus sp.]|uniref:NUDIX hydrolase n=1 Tax=Methylophilus sp. TaxID=29541 RepID=UPI002BB11594|nr:NUDIX hydrolase [Methylophilus sp.]HSH87035.1 NUDIX hydrolase [Methylophilus sp.]
MTEQSNSSTAASASDHPVDQHLIETTVSSEILAQGKMLTVRYDQARLPNGTISGREYVIHPGAVVVVALTQDGGVVLERQFRYPLKQVFVELPAGKIDPGEPVLQTGQRELLEETGYSGNEWVKLGIQHPCIGYSNEVIHIYLATGLTLGAHARDIDEAMDVFVWPFARVIQAIESGEITDSKTMGAMLLAERYLLKHPVPGLSL